MENEIKLAHHCKTYITTSLFLSYIKLIYKMNTSMCKYDRTSKEIYINETINIIYTINNSIDITSKPELLLFYIEDVYKEMIKNLILRIK